MRLIYDKTGEEVSVGDLIVDDDGRNCMVSYFRPPHKPSSSGKISIDYQGDIVERYVHVYDMTWIEREDRS